jgi:WD40 repeat protein
VLWNWQTDEVRQIPTAVGLNIAEQQPLIRAVQFNPEGTQILVSGISGISKGAQLFDMASGELVREYSGHNGVIYSVDFSPDGRSIATSSEDDTLLLWSVDESQPMRRVYGHTDDVNSVRFSADGRSLVSGGFDKIVLLWDVGTGSEIQRFYTNAPVLTATFGSESSSIFTGGDNGILRRWQVRALPDLLSWIEDNRYIADLTCEQRNFYQISSADCGA